MRTLPIAVALVAILIAACSTNAAIPPKEEKLFHLPDGESLFIRTDFSSDAAWLETLNAAQQPWDLGGGAVSYANITPVDERRFQGMTVDTFEKLLPAPPPYYLFIADTRTLTDAEHPILVVDTSRMNETVVGFQTFRVAPSELASVENNLSLANMDFEDFSTNVDPDGVFRGF